MSRSCWICGSDMIHLGESEVEGEPIPANKYGCRNPDCPETVYVSQVIDR